METQEPDLEASRALFTELEFTSMLRELAPSVTPLLLLNSSTSPQTSRPPPFTQQRARADSPSHSPHLNLPRPESETGELDLPQTLSLLDVFEEAEKKTQSNVGVSVEPGKGLCLSLTPELKSLLEDENVPKRVHDLKLALHVLGGLGVNLRGKVTTPCCFPMHSTRLIRPTPSPMSPRVTTRQRHHLCLVRPRRRRLSSPIFAPKSNAAMSRGVYEEIDLPLAPVLYRMEKSGVRIDTAVLDGMSRKFGAELERVGEQIYALAGRRFNVNSPSSLARCCSRTWDCRSL